MRNLSTNDNVTSSEGVLTKLKVMLGVKSAKELARIFNLKPNTISSWKKRNTMSYSKIIEVCYQNQINLNELFYSDYHQIEIDRGYTNIPIIYIDDYLEYYLNIAKNKRKLKQLYVPLQVNFDIVIQLYSNIIDHEELKLIYAFCKKTDFSQLVVEKSYVFLIKNKGFQCYKMVGFDRKENKIGILKEGTEIVWIDGKDMVECFQCMDYLLC